VNDNEEAKVPMLKFASMYYPFFGKLLDGHYASDGIEMMWQYISPPDRIFRQVIESATYDLAEMSLSTYTMLRDQGWDKYVGLPIFTSKRFRHSALFVKAESDLVSGEQLKGKKIGLPEYGMTAAVWIRGILQEDFGVDPTEIEWFTGGAERPGGRSERVKLPAAIAGRIHRVGQSDTLFKMLLDNRLDAVMCVHKPELLQQNASPIRSLFPNCREVEKKYYLKHQIFPIMHMLVLRKDLPGNVRDTANRIHRVVQDLRNDFFEKMMIVRKNAVFPWFDEYVEEIIGIMGENPWEHGISKNAQNLNKFLDYSNSQGLIQNKLALEELFIDLDD